jgi:sugar lactone lactonase YvrE
VEPGLNAIRLDEGPSLGVTSKGNWFRIEGSEIVKRAPTGEESVIVSGLDRPRGLALDPEGNLLVFEGGTGRILRVEAVDGELKPGAPSRFSPSCSSPGKRGAQRSPRKL